MFYVLLCSLASASQPPSPTSLLYGRADRPQYEVKVVRELDEQRKALAMETGDLLRLAHPLSAASRDAGAFECVLPRVDVTDDGEELELIQRRERQKKGVVVSRDDGGDGGAPKEADAAAAPTAEVDAAALASELRDAAQLLTRVDTSCLYRQAGWWTYELCTAAERVRQFHAPEGAAATGAAHGVALPASPDTVAYALGTRLVSNSAVLTDDYYAVAYDGGDVCELTESARRVEVRYSCAPNKDTSWIVRIDEPAACSYVMKVMTPYLCELPRFKPYTKPIHAIECAYVGAPAATEKVVARLLQRAPRGAITLGDLTDAVFYDDGGDGESAARTTRRREERKQTGEKATTTHIKKTKKSMAPTTTTTTFDEFRRSEHPSVAFAVGQMIVHRKYNYRGVIVDWDPTCAADESWMTTMKVDELTHGRDQPFYKCLVDVRDRQPPQVTYVAQENIVLFRDSSRFKSLGDNVEDFIIKHPNLLGYMQQLDASQVGKVFRYEPVAELRKKYPED